tara:strand:+ start:52 stop:582 length:531 start_codon:yes stop_codon:yes gene_type:complete
LIIKNFLIILFLLISLNIHAANVIVINIEYVINNSSHYKDIINKMDDDQQSFQESFQNNEIILNEKANKIEANRLILSKTALEEELQNYNQMLSDFKNTVNSYNTHYENEILKIRNEIIDKILALLQDYANKNKIDLIFDSNNYIMASNSLNVTEEILSELNKLEIKLSFESFKKN